MYAPNSLIQPVERTISLEIVHPEVQRCFLRCFNDGYKNSNLRPAAGDWVKALRFAVNELTICGKVDSHYYSRTYGECYWCDRSTKLGIDIFPGFARPKQQSAFVESTSKGIAIMMEHLSPGKGGRHRQTISYGKSPNLSLSARETLTQEVWDVRSIYLRQGLYNREIRKSLQGLINLNRLTWQGIFDKVG